MIVVMTSAPDKSGIKVSFNYDPELVDLIKSLPRYDRVWLADSKCWRVATSARDSCAGLFVQAGHTVMLDGQKWEPPKKEQKRESYGDERRYEPPPRQKAHQEANYFVSFLNALPQRYRMPVWKALWKVLHPDVGGDTAIAQQLNEARPRSAA